MNCTYLGVLIKRVIYHLAPFSKLKGSVYCTMNQPSSRISWNPHHQMHPHSHYVIPSHSIRCCLPKSWGTLALEPSQFQGVILRISWVMVSPDPLPVKALGCKANAEGDVPSSKPVHVWKCRLIKITWNIWRFAIFAKKATWCPVNEKYKHDFGTECFFTVGYCPWSQLSLTQI